MSYIDWINEGQSGRYLGLNNGLGRINNYIYNVQRSWYYLIGGLSNTGKTTFVDSILLNALREAKSKDIKVDVFYYSYEIDKKTKFTQWLSNHIYHKYDIEIAPEAIAGLGDNRLKPHEEELVRMEVPHMQEIFDRINFRFDATNPTGIYKELFDHFESTGTFVKEKYSSMSINDYGEQAVDNKERIKEYIPSDPNRYVIAIIDHMALCKLERKFTLKENIDKLSNYFVTLRNICGLTIFALQQFNQGLHAIDRKKYNGEDLLPQQNDFKDSTNPYTDSDTALGIMNPHAMNSASEKIVGYNISKTSGIKGNFRIVHIIKNRKGRAELSFGYFFNAKMGYFSCLPLPDKLTKDDLNNINTGKYNT